VRWLVISHNALLVINYKYIVKACQDGKEKLLFVLVPGADDAGKLQHLKDEKKRASFKARHNCSDKPKQNVCGVVGK
jgi:hypothetical protein